MPQGIRCFGGVIESGITENTNEAMISLNEYKGVAVAVYGLSKTGIAAALTFKASGAQLFAWDENADLRDQAMQQDIGCVHPKDWDWEKLRAIVPGLDKHRPFRLDHPIIERARQFSVPLKSDKEIFGEYVAALPESESPKIIGVTGSHGKTVTVEMIGHILSTLGLDVYVSSDRGASVLTHPEGNWDSVYVVELSPRDLFFSDRLRCHVAVHLNTSEVDTATFRDIDAHVHASSRIFRHQSGTDSAIIGVDDPVGQKLYTALSTRQDRNNTPMTTIPISGESTLGEGIFSLDGAVFKATPKETIPIGQLAAVPAIIGSHFNQDVAAAITACLSLGVKPAMAERALYTFGGVPMRMECLGDARGVVFFDDSMARSVHAAVKGILSGYDIFWIAGGGQQGQNFMHLAPTLKRVQKAFLFGSAATSLGDSIAPGCSFTIFKSEEEATRQAIIQATAHAKSTPEALPVVLFSPACKIEARAAASDSFRNIITHYLKETRHE